MNLVRILKNIRGLKGLEEEMYIKSRENIFFRGLILICLSSVFWFLFLPFSLTRMGSLSVLSRLCICGATLIGGKCPPRFSVTLAGLCSDLSPLPLTEPDSDPLRDSSN